MIYTNGSSFPSGTFRFRNHAKMRVVSFTGTWYERCSENSVMNWTDCGYGLALTIIVGTVLAFLPQWRDVGTRRAAEAERRRVDQRAAASMRREIGRRIDRAA